MRRLLAGLAAALVGPTATAPPATAVGTTESGTFSVLTYSIAGPPESISSAPTPREPATTEIGRRIAPSLPRASCQAMSRTIRSSTEIHAPAPHCGSKVSKRGHGWDAC
ncbi:hypothetical protein [Streptomyces sp. NPDC085466]|uniref:hypothetical protein n=1 Tax=Streptomyces sp. NPDC085466 TaxID=3365725 RepID=UPI0037D7B263